MYDFFLGFCKMTLKNSKVMLQIQKEMVILGKYNLGLNRLNSVIV
jgi:hypothetical protein